LYAGTTQLCGSDEGVGGGWGSRGTYFFGFGIGFLFGFRNVCLRGVLGFDDDGDDGGERGEMGKGVLCEWTRSCLERCVVLCWFGMDREFLVWMLLCYRCLEFLSTVRSDAYFVCY
jgi:hypothetical protein